MIKERENGSWNPSRERRRYGRFTARLPVVSRRDDLSKRAQAAQTAQCRLQLRDFSLGGIHAESAIPLKRNERLTMRLPPYGTQPPLELTGRVIHCRRQEDRYRVGIEFCQTRPEATASPWHRMFRLFTMAFEPPASELTLGRIRDA